MWSYLSNFSILKSHISIIYDLERGWLAVLQNDFFQDINLHESLLFVVQNLFLNAEIDLAF